MVPLLSSSGKTAGATPPCPYITTGKTLRTSSPAGNIWELCPQAGVLEGQEDAVGPAAQGGPSEGAAPEHCSYVSPALPGHRLVTPRILPPVGVRLAEAAEAPGPWKVGVHPASLPLPCVHLPKLYPPGTPALPYCPEQPSATCPCVAAWLGWRTGEPGAWGFARAASQVCGLSGAGSWALASAYRWTAPSGVSGVFSCP